MEPGSGEDIIPEDTIEESVAENETDVTEDSLESNETGDNNLE